VKKEDIGDIIDRHIGYANNTLKARKDETELKIAYLNSYKDITKERTEDLIIEAATDYRRRDIISIELLRRLLLK
jgi:hypothetical protein